MESKKTEEKTESEKESRIREVTHLYYSRADIQKALFAFSANREVVPRYFEGFGHRPDALQYQGDIFELVKKGATSFHCSEELWSDPLKISTSMTPKKLDELRIGWDLLLDIDSKYLDYSKILAQLIIKFLKFYGVVHIGIKFSGSKGFHIIVPWKSFPKEINEIKLSDTFPEWPRIITNFIIESTKPELIEKVSKLSESGKYIKDFQASKEVMPDLILVSPRHLFRMPYSLHEKTALASVVIKPEELETFQPKDADPFNAKVRNFMPEPKDGEATKLVREALDWYKNLNPEGKQNESKERKQGDFKTITIQNLSDEFLPPTIKQILLGVRDGRKRALFVLLNLFRSIGMERGELEKRIYDWNKKNEIPLLDGYIKSQLSWSYRNKIVPPPNYDKDYYKALGLTPTEEELRYKNPTNYVVRKATQKQQWNKPARKGDD